MAVQVVDGEPTGTDVLDAYWAAGGRAFGSTWVADGAAAERALGQWLARTGRRAESVVIGQGAHVPFGTPDRISAELTESLERLQTDHVDVYLLHRDNLDVPVGEFVDAINAEVNAGRIRGPWGGSNWTVDRLDVAIEYAESEGEPPPRLLANNLSLATMVQPMFSGCVSSSGADFRAWLNLRQVANLSWAATGCGFFTDRAAPDRTDDPELTRVWYSEDNFARRDRAIRLATQLGVTPNQVALAWAIGQPFVSIPIVDPRSTAELAECVAALDVRLTPDQSEWLEYGD